MKLSSELLLVSEGTQLRRAWCRAAEGSSEITTEENSIGVDEIEVTNLEEGIILQEGAKLQEVTDDLDSTAFGPVSPVTTSGVGNPSACGAGCRSDSGSASGPSPSPSGISVASNSTVLRHVLEPVWLW